MAATASPARLGYRPALLPEVGEFVSRTVSRPADSDIRRLAATLHDQTQGNPFFMEEVLRPWSSGAMPDGTVRVGPASSGQMTVPAGVRDVVRRRIGRISRHANDLLSVAALVGPEFDMEVLAALSDLTEDDLLDAMDERWAPA